MGAELGYVGQNVLVGVAVDERVGHVIDAFLGVENMHRSESLELGPDTDDFLGHF